MRKTILKETEEVFILVMGYCFSSNALPFSLRTKIDTKERFGHSQSHKENFCYKCFRSLGIDYRAIRDDIVDWLSPKRDEYRITQ